MARTTIPPAATVLGSYPSLALTANSVDLAMTAGDVSNKNQSSFGAATRMLLVAQNTHATTAYSVTITSRVDTFNRSGDITAYNMDAGDISTFGPFERTGWMQTDGYLYYEASNAAIKFAIIPL